MKKIYLMALQIIAPAVYAQTINYTVNSSALSNNKMNYVVGLTYVPMTYASQSAKISESENNSNALSSIDAAARFSFFPNPVTDKLYFEKKGEAKFEILVYDDLGRLAFEKKVEGNCVDLSNLTKGSYIIISKTQEFKPFKILKN